MFEHLANCDIEGIQQIGLAKLVRALVIRVLIPGQDNRYVVLSCKNDQFTDLGAEHLVPRLAWYRRNDFAQFSVQDTEFPHRVDCGSCPEPSDAPSPWHLSNLQV